MPYPHKKRERVLASIKRHGLIFDPEWVEKLCELGYSISLKNGYALIRLTVPGDSKSQGLLVHRIIMNAPDGVEVDHINRVREDNRVENLRLVERSINRKNRALGWTYKYQKPKRCILCGQDWAPRK